MKKGIYFILIFSVLVCIFQFNCYGEQEQKLSENENNKIENPYFMPEGKTIREVIYKKIYITECLYGNYKFPEKIYFSDDDGNLIKTIDLPKTTYLFFIKSSSTEYLGIHYLYARNVTEQSLGESEFIVYNDEGEVVWENYGSNDRKIFIGADNKIIFAYLHRGYLDIYNIYGKHIKKTKLSDWTEIPYPEEELLINPRIAMSENGKYLLITRSGYYPKKKSELIFLDIDGNIIWKKVFKDAERYSPNISTSGKYIVCGRCGDVEEGMLEVYNKSGKLLWEKKAYRCSRIKVDFSNDEKLLKIEVSYYPTVNGFADSSRIIVRKITFESKTGKIISEKITEKQNK